MWTRQFCCRLLGLAAATALHAQEKPLSVSTTVTTGYYTTSTRGEANQSTTFAPVGARFEMSGYYMWPELVSFSAQPEINVGPQASDAGFQGGNGIRLSVSFLRKSFAPLTFRYANVQVEDVYFGGLSQLSGYSLKERNKDLGIMWELKPRNLPVTTLDWGTGSVDSRSSIGGVTDYQSRGDHLNVDSRYLAAGWDIGAFVRRNRQDSDLLAPIDGGTGRGSLRQAVLQSQGSASHSFLGDSEFYVDGGIQSTSSLLIDLPIDLSTRYAGASLRLRQRHRWKSMLRATYSSNLSSQLLAMAAATLNTPGAAVLSGNVLEPFSHGLENFSLSGVTSADLGRGIGVYGSAERNAIYSNGQNGPIDSDYFTTSAGVTFSRKFRWGATSGEYAREFGAGSLIGQSGTIQGQRYATSAQLNTASGLSFDGTIHGASQDVRGPQSLANRSFAAEASVADRVAGGFSARAGGGWQWGSIVNAANEFRTSGYTARLCIEHPRFQVSASLNSSLSNSLPFYNQLLTGLGVESMALTSLDVVPSDYRATSFTLHANPIRKVELSASWTRSRQRLEGILNNDFELLNAYATYHFRKVQLEAGYILSNQAFSFYPSTLRKRLYVRVVRSAKLL